MLVPNTSNLNNIQCTLFKPTFYSVYIVHTVHTVKVGYAAGTNVAFNFMLFWNLKVTNYCIVLDDMKIAGRSWLTSNKIVH